MLCCWWRSQGSGHSLVLKALQWFPQTLRAKGADPTFKEFTRQGQHLACIPAPHSPLQETAVLVELNNVPQPCLTHRTRNHDHVRHIARADTTTDGQLDSLQQSPFPPFGFQPLYGNFGQTTLHIAATTPSADRNLPDHEAFRFQRIISIVSHKA